MKVMNKIKFDVFQMTPIYHYLLKTLSQVIDAMLLDNYVLK